MKGEVARGGPSKRSQNTVVGDGSQLVVAAGDSIMRGENMARDIQGVGGGTISVTAISGGWVGEIVSEIEKIVNEVPVSLVVAQGGPIISRNIPQGPTQLRLSWQRWAS